MKVLKLFIRQRRGKVALTLLLLLGQSVGTLLIPYLIAGVVDDGILAGDMGAVLRLGGWMLAVSLLSAGVAVWGSWCSADLAALFGRDMRVRLFRKSQELSVREFDEVGVSSMVTRSTSDIATMQTTVGLVLQLVIPAPILAAASVGMTIHASPRLALVLIVSVAVFLAFAALMLKLSGRLSRQIQVRLDRINQVVREAVTGTRVIRAFGNEDYEAERSGRAYRDYADTMIRLNKLFAVVNPAVWLLVGLCMAAVVWLGGTLAVGGRLEVGQITAVAEYAILTLSYLIMAAAISASLPKMRSCLDRLEEVLDMEPAIREPAAPHETGRKDATTVSFEHVTFAYPGAEEAVIRDLSFQCRAGETTAVIGGTGAGKSTVAELLLRLHDVDAGVVRLNGADVRTLSQRRLRDAVGCVPQKAFLFSGTIADNLRMGREDATDEELWQALRIAQAESFVSRLPLQLQAPVAQGGANFSGGQRQRLAIARALVKQADVYAFDDSFSALDVKTDAALRRALTAYGTSAAKLIIAQRVSTILDADQILVLDEGRLVGRGRHEELLETCEIYRAIVRSQTQQKDSQGGGTHEEE